MSSADLKVSVRWFEERDIPYKVRWINDPEVNRYLHYDIPINEDRTAVWYRRILQDPTRVDFVIEVMNDGERVPVGVIGLLNIDLKMMKAEFYIAVGDKNYWGQGVATIAAKKFIRYSFKRFPLNKIYLFTEKDNLYARRLFERLGFKCEGLLRQDVIHMGRKIDRYVYGLLREECLYAQDSTDPSSYSVT